MCTLCIFWSHKGSWSHTLSNTICIGSHKSCDWMWSRNFEVVHVQMSFRGENSTSHSNLNCNLFHKQSCFMTPVDRVLKSHWLFLWCFAFVDLEAIFMVWKIAQRICWTSCFVLTTEERKSHGFGTTTFYIITEFEMLGYLRFKIAFHNE